MVIKIKGFEWCLVHVIRVTKCLNMKLSPGSKYYLEFYNMNLIILQILHVM